MDKLTNILAVIDTPEDGTAVVDKAVTLARHFGANVQVLITRESLLEPLAAHCAHRRYDAVVLLDPPVEGATTTTAILAQLARQPVDLVIKAGSGAHPLRRWTLDLNDRILAQRCPVPLLLTRATPWNSVPRMATCVDVSDPEGALFARALLQSTGFLATGSGGFLDVLYSEREQTDERTRMERAVKLAQLVREFYMGSERLQMFNGAPEKVLPSLIEARHYDVLAIGAVTHRTGLSSWPESLSSRLTDATAGDVLLVKPATPSARADAAAGSAREQLADLA